MKQNKKAKNAKQTEKATATATANPAEIAPIQETTETATAEVFEATPATACKPATAEQEQTARAPRGKLQVGVTYKADSGANVAITESDNSGAFTLYQVSVNGEAVTTPIDSPNVKRMLTATTLSVKDGDVIVNGATVKPRCFAAKQTANGDHAPRTATKLHTQQGAAARAAALFADIFAAAKKLQTALEAVQRFELEPATATTAREELGKAAETQAAAEAAAEAKAQQADELENEAELARSQHADSAAANADNIGETAEAAEAAIAAYNEAAEAANEAFDKLDDAQANATAAYKVSEAIEACAKLDFALPSAESLTKAIKAEATQKIEQAKATQAARKEAAAAINQTDPATAAQLAQLLKDPAKLAAVLAQLNN